MADVKTIVGKLHQMLSFPNTKERARHNTSRYYYGYDLDYTSDAYAFVMFGVAWLITIVAEKLAR